MPLTLKARYALIILGLTLATVVSLSAALLTGFRVTSVQLRESTIESMDHALVRQYERRAVELARTLGMSIADELYLLDVDHIQQMVEDVSNLPDVSAIAVFDTQGLLFNEGLIPGLSSTESQAHLRLDTHFSERSTVTTLLEKHPLNPIALVRAGALRLPRRSPEIAHLGSPA